MNRKTGRFLGVDMALIALSVIVLCVSLFYFFQDDGISPDFEALTPIGKIDISRNDVRRRTQTGLAWSNVSTKDRVFEGDSIFTGEDSEASIDLDGGGRLQVEPRSLIVLKNENGKYSLDLKYGSLTGKVESASGLLIRQNGEVQELSGSNAEVRIEKSAPGQETRIQVTKGEVEVRTVELLSSDGKKKKSVAQQALDEQRALSGKVAAPPKQKAPSAPQTLKKNDVVALGPKQDAVVKRVMIELTRPAAGQALWLAPGQALSLDWKVNEGAKSKDTRVEVATDPGFTQLLFAQDTLDLHAEMAAEKIPAGSLYWRVTPKDTSAIGASARFTTYPDLPPQPTFPTDLQEFSLDEKSAQGKPVMLAWQDSSGSVEFEYQLGKDEHLTQTLETGRVKASSERTKPLTEGRYFWRVRGLNEARKNPPWSRIVSFHIGSDSVAPTPPKLVFKVINYEIPLAVLRKAPPGLSMKGRGIAPEDIQPFEWPQVPGAESYEVEVSSNDKFLNSMKQTVGAENKFSPQEVKPGSLYVRVRSKGKKGVTTDPSETGRLDVKVPAPLIDPVKPVTDTFPSTADLEKGQRAFPLNWSQRPFAETYELEWGADDSFTKSKKFRLLTTSREVKFSRPGDYAARVRALDQNGEPISAYSPVMKVSYRKELSKPVPKPVIPPIAKATPEPPPKPIIKAPASVKAALRDGKEGSPILLEPTRDTSFVAFEGSTLFINMRWKPVPQVVEYEIQFASDADFVNIVQALKTKRAGTIMRKALPEGRVFWRVRGFTQQQTLTEWSSVYDINVLYQ